MRIKQYLKRILARTLCTFVEAKSVQNNLTISTNPPLNLRIEEKRFFPSHINYSIQEGVNIKGVFVTRSGIVLKGFQLLGNSVHSNYNDHVIHCYKYALGNYFFRKRLKTDNGETYILIHNHWCPGYYHWITEALHRLWSVKEHISSLTLIIPKSFKGPILESLEPFQFKSRIVVPNNKNLKLKNLFLPPNPTACEQYNPLITKEIRNFYQEYLQMNKGINLSFGSRIYISREKARNRKVDNEGDVINLIEKYEFKKVNFEDFSFWEQISIVNNAKCVISIHGAGLTNIHFMNEGSSILELQKEPSQPSDFYSSVYFTLASVLGIKYLYQLCKPLKSNDTVFHADIIVDLNTLEENIRLMLYV